MYHFGGDTMSVSVNFTGERMQIRVVESASVGVVTYGDTYGECFYCRDGERVKLYSYRVTYRHAGDVVSDTELVCRSCYNWLGEGARD
jgi:hypothetical protein